MTAGVIVRTFGHLLLGGGKVCFISLKRALSLNLYKTAHPDWMLDRLLNSPMATPGATAFGSNSPRLLRRGEAESDLNCDEVIE
jgi:hypothetical protein